MSTSKVKKLNIEGLIPAVYAPYDKNGELNLSIIPLYAEFLSKQGVKGIFVNGTTGESLLLSIKERKLILEAWMKVAKKYNFKVLAMISTNSIKDSQDLAIHAQSVGVDGMNVHKHTHIHIYIYVYIYISYK